MKLLPGIVVISPKDRERVGAPINRVLHRRPQWHDLNVHRRVGLRRVRVTLVEPLDHPSGKIHVLLGHRTQYRAERPECRLPCKATVAGPKTSTGFCVTWAR